MLCAASALGYGLLGLFGRAATAAGASVPTTIAWRFGLAAVVLAAVVLLARRPLGRGRAVWQPLLMGAVVYSLQSSLYFWALTQIPAGLTALLLYTMPALVVVVELVRRTLRLSALLVVAVLAALGGVALTMTGPVERLSLPGVLAGLGSAVAYTVYYFSMQHLPPRTDWVASSLWVCVGAAASQAVVGAVRGTLDPAPGRELLLGSVLPMALLCTVVSLSLLMVGIRLAGPSVAAVASCVEPVSAVVIGALLLGDPFGTPQLLGAALVAGAVVVLGLRPGEPGGRLSPGRARSAAAPSR
nr:DMT family transporter [Auraticoccus cholistanensis]